MRDFGESTAFPMPFPAHEFLDFSETEHERLFVAGEPVWTALTRIGAYLEERLERVGSSRQEGSVDPRAIVGDRVYVAHGAVIEANAVVKGPAWIGSGTVVRSGAYVRDAKSPSRDRLAEFLRDLPRSQAR